MNYTRATIFIIMCCMCIYSWNYVCFWFAPTSAHMYTPLTWMCQKFVHQTSFYSSFFLTALPNTPDPKEIPFGKIDAMFVSHGSFAMFLYIKHNVDCGILMDTQNESNKNIACSPRASKIDFNYELTHPLPLARLLALSLCFSLTNPIPSHSIHNDVDCFGCFDLFDILSFSLRLLFSAVPRSIQSHSAPLWNNFHAF